MSKRSAPLDKRAPTNAYQAFALERRPLLPNDMCCGEREKFLGQLWKALLKTEKDKWKVESNAYTRPVPYYAFCKEQRPLLPPALQNKERDAALGQMWRALPPTERAKYEVDGSRAPPVPSVATALAPPAPYASAQILGGHWKDSRAKTAATILNSPAAPVAPSTEPSAPPVPPAPPAPPALTLPASQSQSPYLPSAASTSSVAAARPHVERHNWVEELLSEQLEVGVSMDLDSSIESIESVTWSPSPLASTGVDELGCSIDSSSSTISLHELAQLVGEAMEVLAEQSREQGQS